MSTGPGGHGSERADGAEPIESTSPQVAAAAEGRGVRQLTANEFSLAESVGGVRGLIETIAPGLVFVVIFVATRELVPAVVASVSVAVVASIARLIGRTPLTQALSGLVGVAIGAVWAWRSGEASDFFAWGLLVNAGFAVGVLISILVRWPVVGVLVATLTGQDTSWRADERLRRLYVQASWLWFGAFIARLAVQVPLYLNAEAGWLGTARLVMGVPMWALVLWITWLWVRPRADAARSPDRPVPPT
ncbi:DUF3159 domain-containing protein [Ruania halotolerans]|uniref:DUF3159 domain-containing protein n=1 Tax=Ruania halotolerans TaxID=2897773 RepID=UPI001E398BC6|nr:DUF3159 domain-containing protein [Ruania halotolerans]UFU04801.1 DUF3159 domain-containing protein [Ruania halotolerans]